MQNERSVPPQADQRRNRGRPRAFDREAALRAAMRLFWSKGYAATSISDLTEAMGIGSPSLYAAFGSKEALYTESIRFYGTERGPLVWGRFGEAGTAREALDAFLMDSAVALTRTGRAGDPSGCMVTLSAVASEGCTKLGRLVQGLRAEALAVIAARLDRAVSEGELPETLDREGVARFFLAVQGGMSIQARDGASRAELERAARAAMAGWAGIVAAGD